MPTPAVPQLPKRAYKDGVDLSIIGLGGVAVVGQPQERVSALVAESVARGVNYFDVAPSYGNGEAEEKLGVALQPYRDRVFLACKTIHRDAKQAREELEHSLARLRTDHFDLYQAHAVCEPADIEKFVAPGGALEVFREAQRKGQTRFLGFSSHSEKASTALFKRFAFDSVLFPINFVCYAHGDFGAELIRVAKEHHAARLTIKSLARGRLPKGTRATYPNCWYAAVEDPAQAELAFRFTLSEEVTATVPGGDVRLYERCLAFAQRFKPLSAEERAQLLAQAADVTPLFSA